MTISYSLEYEIEALKQLAKIPTKKAKRQLLGKIEQLENDPHPKGSKKLSCKIATFRLRSGRYRILYQVDSVEKIITITSISDRKDVYRDF